MAAVTLSLGATLADPAPDLALAAGPPSPTTVHVRVEGDTGTLIDRDVATTPHDVTTASGGTHFCANPSSISGLDDAARAAGVTWDASYSGDFFVSRIGSLDSNTSFLYWGSAVDGKAQNIGGCGEAVPAGSEIVWAYDAFGGPPDYAFKPLLRITGPASADRGAPVALRVVDAGTGDPIAGAALGGSTTAADGRVTLSFDTIGTRTLKAEKTGTIRSRAFPVCVHDGDDGTCGTPPPPVPPVVKPTALPGSGTVIDGVRTYRAGRGPRTLRGTATVGSDPIREVKIRLRGRSGRRGTACRYYSVKTERFRATRCGTGYFGTIADSADWSYLLPKRVPSGRWTLDVRYVDTGFRTTDAEPVEFVVKQAAR